MASPHEILTKLTNAIEKEVNGFDKSVPALQKGMYNRVLEMLKNLELKNGRIQASVKNILMIGKIKAELETLILNKAYVKQVNGFLTAFDTVDALQKSYFSEVAVEVTPNKLLGALKHDAVKYTADSLTKMGVNSKVLPGIETILRSNIAGGGSMADLTDQLRQYITTTKTKNGESLGALQRHTRQITTDAVNQYSANYNAAISQDLGFEWYAYQGSLLATSRPWCRHMVKKRFVHKSELKTVIFDQIDGVKICSKEIPCSKKTDLPSGMIEGTNESNVIIRRGGWNCGHQFGGVPSAMVPKSLRDKFAI